MYRAWSIGVHLYINQSMTVSMFQVVFKSTICFVVWFIKSNFPFKFSTPFETEIDFCNIVSSSFPVFVSGREIKSLRVLKDSRELIILPIVSLIVFVISFGLSHERLATIGYLTRTSSFFSCDFSDIYSSTILQTIIASVFSNKLLPRICFE